MTRRRSASGTATACGCSPTSARSSCAAAVNERPRPGVVIVDHGWGSRIFDPRGGGAPESFGANRNLLIDGGPVDPLSQTSALSSSYVGVERVGSEF